MEVILADKELMTKTMRRLLKINDITVDLKWITTLETAGNVFTKADDTMATSPFTIQIESKEVPQVAKIADTCVFVLKLIECHSMRIKDLTTLSEENIGDIRMKLAADIFSKRWSKDAQRSGEETFPFLFQISPVVIASVWVARTRVLIVMKRACVTLKAVMF
ncbi:unnamed protein product [Thlaspi arvense]|uniref:Ubiquitin-like protease family profile domain-containing protein n=1 Tax=Thlaspi arvense TaxID=13288 RepID=A0AAU9RU29_THLAR|nr:unnamed protein product [Thlaspi arvense]